VQKLTVDERTRRRIADIEEAALNRESMDAANNLGPEAGQAIIDRGVVDSIIDGDKIEIDFDNLSSDLLSFEVRAGSLIENERETERQNIQEMLIPVSQMIGNISEQNKDAFEDVIMQLVTRLCELSDIDISATTAQTIDNKLIAKALQATMSMVDQQQQQIGQMQQMMGLPEGGMPPEMNPGLAQAAAAGAPMPEQPVPPEMMQQPTPMPPEMMASPDMQAPMPEASAGMPEDIMPPVSGAEEEEMPLM
jgi:hypothetical protein